MITVRLNSETTTPNGAGRGRTIGQTEPLDVRLTILSGNDLYHYIPSLDDDGWGSEYTRFVFDLDSVQFNDRIPLDYNHYDDEVIGSIDRIAAEDGRLAGVGKIVPFRPDDRAAEVAYKIGLVPFGVSPTVTFDEATVTRVPKGVSVEVNGRVYDGEISIIHNARILGAAVCPYPTDTGTTVAALAAHKSGGIRTMSILKPVTEELEADIDVTKKDKGAADEINTADHDRDGAGGTDPGNADPDAGGENGGESQGAGEEDGGADPAPTDGETDGGENAGGETGGDGSTEPVTDPEDDGSHQGDIQTEGNPTDGEGEGGDGEGGEGGGGDAGLKAEVAELRKEVAALRAEVARNAGLARHGAGTEPVGFSHEGKNEMSYADAVAARLEKLKNQ